MSQHRVCASWIQTQNCAHRDTRVPVRVSILSHTNLLINDFQTRVFQMCLQPLCSLRRRVYKEWAYLTLVPKKKKIISFHQMEIISRKRWIHYWVSFLSGSEKVHTQPSGGGKGAVLSHTQGLYQSTSELPEIHIRKWNATTVKYEQSPHYTVTQRTYSELQGARLQSQGDITRTCLLALKRHSQIIPNFIYASVE